MISQVRLFAASSPAEQFPRHSFAHKRTGVLLREKNEFADFHNPDCVGAEALCKCGSEHLAKKVVRLEAELARKVA
jgi:hypothetical protein